MSQGSELTILPKGLAQDAYQSAFERDGFVAVDLFSPEEVEDMRRMVADLIAKPWPAHPRLQVFAAAEEPVPGLDPANPYAVYKVGNTPLAGDAWVRLLMRPEVLTMAASLLGSDINFHMGFLRLRPPGLHVDEGWHTDYESDRHNVPGLLTALIYLDEMSVESGATQVVPGSHRTALVEGTYEPAPLTTPRPQDVCHAVARPGTVLFLHCLTVHSVADNRTRTNRSIILHEYKQADAVEVDENPAAFGDLPLVRAGWMAQPPPAEGGWPVDDSHSRPHSLERHEGSRPGGGPTSWV